MMAKPAVEPRARCALMIPDAMPARSGGIDAMATLVVGASARPAEAPTSTSPTRTATRATAHADTITTKPSDEQREAEQRRARGRRCAPRCCRRWAPARSPAP